MGLIWTAWIWSRRMGAHVRGSPSGIKWPANGYEDLIPFPSNLIRWPVSLANLFLLIGGCNSASCLSVISGLPLISFLWDAHKFKDSDIIISDQQLSFLFSYIPFSDGRGQNFVFLLKNNYFMQNFVLWNLLVKLKVKIYLKDHAHGLYCILKRILCGLYLRTPLEHPFIHSPW